MENKNNTNLIEKKEESKKDEPSQKYETIKEAMGFHMKRLCLEIKRK